MLSRQIFIGNITLNSRRKIAVAPLSVVFEDGVGRHRFRFTDLSAYAQWLDILATGKAEYDATKKLLRVRRLR